MSNKVGYVRANETNIANTFKRIRGEMPRQEELRRILSDISRGFVRKHEVELLARVLGVGDDRPEYPQT